MAKCTKDYKNVEKPYLLLEEIRYYSKRYDKCVLVKEGKRSDGATGAFDIASDSWWIHDELCDTGKFLDGSPCNNWQASSILSDVLKSEGRWFRSRSWFIMTWLLGGDKARANGMW